MAEKKSKIKWVSAEDELQSAQTKSLTETSVELGKKTLGCAAIATKKSSVLIGILCLLLSAIFIFLFAGSYHAFFAATSENLFVFICVLVLGAILTGSFCSKMLFLLVPEAVVSKVAAALHVPLEIAAVVTLIALMAIFSAISALTFFILGFLFLGVGSILRLHLKKSSWMDFLAGVTCIILAVPAFISSSILGIIFGGIMALIGALYLFPVPQAKSSIKS
ncbi:hypothetical protein JW721_06370 [Candidatus Micrarchaeota archaeon]|nr:hypothetical protein [Candidatus Micrarchaeota archaeon]